MKPVYFATAADLRRWLENHHSTERELEIGFFNRSSGKGGITYGEALDEALCFGWIDGIVHKIDAARHTRRFTPRKPGSVWSRVNVGHVERLTREGRMQPPGIAAFGKRDEKKTGIYSFEVRPEEFPSALEKVFRLNQRAWSQWKEQPPGYRRRAIAWVISAKRPETQSRRLATLITLSAAGRRLE